MAGCGLGVEKLLAKNERNGNGFGDGEERLGDFGRSALRCSEEVRGRVRRWGLVRRSGRMKMEKLTSISWSL